jgi:maltose alpha-D-glucosyltransferase/alpha-amylase
VADGSGFTPEWIAAQRWFRSKGRQVASVMEVDRAPLSGGASLTVLEVEYADGGGSHLYLTPSIEGREPRDGEGAWAALVGAIAGEAELAGTRGRFQGSRTDALDELLTADRRERRMGVEQSNTSVRVGDRLILKLYRLLEAGENPDVEVSAFLTDAGFPDTPALAGAMTYEADGAASAAAMLQEFVPSTGDAWATMLRALAEDPGDAMAMVERVGDLTARMHAALASRPGDPAFPARAATVAETAAWRRSAERQLAEAVTAVSGRAHDRLVALAPRITARFADTFGSAIGDARVSRIHGDYHLAQLLAREDGGFSVIDFEGEPARPLTERRAPGSPLRDLSGMLRSLDYAARTAEAGRHASGFTAEGWLPVARAALLGGYGHMGPDEEHLLAAFELEKACYEIRYEASNRPAWLRLPLAAVERLVEED